MTGSLHVLTGKIAAGKSTRARALVEEAGGMVLSEDAWLSTLYPGEIADLADYRRSSERLRAAIAPLIVEMVRRGQAVILDFPANTVASRAWMKALADDAGVTATLHFLDPPDDECRARMHARNASGEHPYHVDDATFDQFTAHFVAPTDVEGFAIIRYG
ncbi:ATP-binding protein [Sphingomonas panacisoli]|uniref:ATP-binding protein n=1 Tax=Sphingomonas panacisoli TaxID=1813879 RepID=A0A5B8LJ45_9SPHN|nr:ATP-binding protein [Sphingomonas panacisoli]QDZ08238.1 ATP-binding protein [Sphingomonas panacisoli]